MRLIFFTLQIFVVVLLLLNSIQAQTLEEQLSDIFSDVLEFELVGSPGEHGNHFKPANVAASATVINAMNNFIGSSVSSFPLSSTAAGLTFDFSSGRPVSTSTSFGPIFSERAQTIGSGLFNMGFNLTTINYSKIRGVNTDDLKFSFTHQDVAVNDVSGIYGDSPNEFDTIDFFMNLDVNANIFAFYFTYGITDHLDFSVAVPFINVSIKADPYARINSYTYLTTGAANHHFGSDSSQPVLLNKLEGIDDDATGIGDLAIRLKYNLLNNNTVDLATILEYRTATGDEKNFLGSGNDRAKISLIASKIMGDIAPHINLNYELKNSDTQRDRFGVFLGYDQKLSEKLTLALDFLGEFEMGDKIESLTFPDPIIASRPDNSYSQTTEPTNLPNSSADHLINGAFGIKFSPKKSLMVIANVFFPLNNGGLRSEFIPTLGTEFNF
jgi:hypothetical protein